MTLALDSNVLIDLINDDAAEVRAQFIRAKHSGAAIFVSPQAVHETLYGALISARPMHQTEAEQRLLAQLRVEHFTEADGELSANIRVARRKQGRALSVVDAMIAAHAITRGWTLVTADTDDFSLIPELQLANWRSQSAQQDA